MLPLLTLLAMSAFVPVWEIALVETGSHETLVALGGLYARLVSRQFGAAASPRAGG